MEKKNMQNHDPSNAAAHAAVPLSPEAFAMLGAPHLAYVSPIVTDAGSGFGIHAANGNLLAVLRSRDLAFAAARQNDLEPVSVH